MVKLELTTRTLYKVTTNSDLTEGRGNTVLIGYFMDHVLAQRAAKGKGVFGSDADVEPFVTTVLEVSEDGSSRFYKLGEEIIRPRTKEEIKAEALKKLTPEEQDALGL